MPHKTQSIPKSEAGVLGKTRFFFYYIFSKIKFWGKNSILGKMSPLLQFQQFLLVCWQLKLVIQAGDRVLLTRLYSHLLSTHVAILSLLTRLYSHLLTWLYSVYSSDCTQSTHVTVLRLLTRLYSHLLTWLYSVYSSDCTPSTHVTVLRLLTRLYSVAHDTLTWLGVVGEILQSDVMLTGRPGRFGSTPGLFVGIGF